MKVELKLNLGSRRFLGFSSSVSLSAVLLNLICFLKVIFFPEMGMLLLVKV